MECHLCILPFQVHSHRADHGHRHPFLYCPQPGDKANRAAQMLCAVIINYRVKVLIPETEVWYPGQERPPYVLRNMSGAETDYIILDVDREGGVAIGSRRMALAAQRHFFDTIKGGRSIGEKLTCRVLAVGPRRCLVECGGRDMSLSQKDLTYIATPDLRTRYHPGQTLNCVLKEYDRREGQFWVSVKDTVDNPFFWSAPKAPYRKPPAGGHLRQIRRRRVLHALRRNGMSLPLLHTALRPGFPCGGHGHSGNQAV